MAEVRYLCGCGYFFPEDPNIHFEMGSGEEYAQCPRCGRKKYPRNWIKCPQCGAVGDLDEMMDDEDEVICDVCNYKLDSWDDHRYNKFEKLPQVVCPKCNKSQSLYDMNEEEDKGYWVCNKCGNEWDYDDPPKCPKCGKTPGKLLKVLVTRINKEEIWYSCRTCRYESLNKNFTTCPNCGATVSPDYFDIIIEMGNFICNSCSHKWSSLQFWKDFYNNIDR